MQRILAEALGFAPVVDSQVLGVEIPQFGLEIISDLHGTY